MVGAVELVMVKDTVLVAEPTGVVTVIGPVVATAGTLVMICVAVAKVTVAAATPLNEAMHLCARCAAEVVLSSKALSLPASSDRAFSFISLGQVNKLSPPL